MNIDDLQEANLLMVWLNVKDWFVHYEKCNPKVKKNIKDCNTSYWTTGGSHVIIIPFLIPYYYCLIK